MHESRDTRRVATEELLGVTVSDVSPGTILCVVIGEIDLLTAPTLREKLSTITAVPSHLVIDLSAVQFVASIGLNILVELLAAQEAAGRHLALVIADNQAVTHALQTTGLDQVFELHPDLTAAADTCPSSPVVHERQIQQQEASGSDAGTTRNDC